MTLYNITGITNAIISSKAVALMIIVIAIGVAVWYVMSNSGAKERPEPAEDKYYMIGRREREDKE
jgi:hypothetical protein